MAPTGSWEELGYENANADTLTAGVTILLAPTKVNDFRANWSRYTGAFITDLVDFYGGVAPPTSVLFPASSVYRPDKGQALVYLGSMRTRSRPKPWCGEDLASSMI